MKRAIIDCRMSEKCRKSLQNQGFELINISKNPHYDEPVSAHPDVFIFVYENGIIAEKSAYDALSKHLFDCSENTSLNIECAYETTSDVRYPDDCALNFAKCGNALIGNYRAASPRLLETAEKMHYRKIDVKQGYAKCNTCVVDDNSIITEDNGIAKACAKEGIDVLLLKNHEVKLGGYGNGFIGGASGNYTDENKNKFLYFIGDLKTHTEWKKIYEFCGERNVEVISLSDEPLYDCGSIFFI